MALPPVPEQFVKIFLESLDELRDFLDGTVELFFEEWKGLYGIMPLGDPATDPRCNKMFVPGNSSAGGKHVEFCHHVRTVLRMNQLCVDCDMRRAEEVARSGKPIDYWCDWGLRDMAVPITLHGFCVGIMFCGQKRLGGEEDVEGEQKMEEFARNNNLAAEIRILREIRKQVGSVSRTQIEQMKGFLWATSKYISLILYGRLDHDIMALRDTNRKEIFGVVNRLSNLAWESNRLRFWSDLRKILQVLTDLFDCKGIAVLHSSNGKTNLQCSYGLSALDNKLSEIPESGLLTRDLEPSDGPRYAAVRFKSEVPSCIVSQTVMNIHHKVDMILVDKSRLGADEVIHFFVFFESGLPRKHNLTLQQKEIILDEFVRTTKNVFWLLQQTEKLKHALEDKDKFLKDVAHQVNQPLHSLVARCDNFVSPDFPAEKKTRLPVYMREAALHCSFLVRCVEYLARGEKDFWASQKPEPDTYQLTKIIIEFAINVQGYGEERNVRVHVDEPAADAIGNVYLDRRLLEMAMTNVIFNAVKYSFDDTTTVITAYHDTENGLLILAVKNVGIEIPKEMRKKIFERGVRTSEAVQFSYSGLGIGLFVTSGIMKALGGRAWVMQSDLLDEIENPRRKGKTVRRYETIIALGLPEQVILGKRRNTP